MKTRPTAGFINIIFWMVTATLATFMALNTIGWSYTPEGYVPAGNDSFYHARRITDTIADPSAFFEFDNRIHVPEGSWITWPWAYDYSVALIGRTAMALTGITDPMRILAYVPIAWTFVNTGLILLVASALRLAIGWRLLAGIVFALSATNQSLHGAGMLDHHYVELSFILATLWSSIVWADRPNNPYIAGGTAILLALAPAFHVALFILQLPVLLILLRLWVRGSGPNTAAVVSFCSTIVTTTVLMLLGSEPFLEGIWAYYLFSLFHLYIAACSALAVAVMAALPYSVRNLLLLGGIALTAAVPLVWEAVAIGGFFQQSIPGLSGIIETQSLLSLVSSNGKYWLSGYFTYLLVVTPVTLGACAWVLVRGRHAREIAFSGFGLLCLPLFFAQVRFQYFGLVFLIIGPLWAADRLMRSIPKSRNVIAMAFIAFYATVLFASAVERSDSRFTPGLSPHYRWVRPLMPNLAKACSQDPGIVLTAANEGNFVRYHSDCSVIANNFLLTDLQAEKYLEVREILSWKPAELVKRRPDIRYVLATHRTFRQHHPSGLVTLANREALRHVNSDTPLMNELLLGSRNDLPEIELIDEVTVAFENGDKVPYARLFRLTPSPPDATQAGE